MFKDDSFSQGSQESFDNKIEEAQKIIEGMSLDELEGFHRELQYSLKWWDAAYRESQTHIYYNESNHHKDAAYSYYNNGPRNIKSISTSPLYEAVRAYLIDNVEGCQDLPTDWLGWLGLSSRQDMENINDAISVIIRAELPIIPRLKSPITNQRVSEAQETIKGFGIKGIFVENPTETGLIETFLQHYKAE